MSKYPHFENTKRRAKRIHKQFVGFEHEKRVRLSQSMQTWHTCMQKDVQQLSDIVKDAFVEKRDVDIYVDVEYDTEDEDDTRDFDAFFEEKK